MKCTKNYNARAQPLFSSLNLLFSDVAVSVTVVVILSSLILNTERSYKRQGHAPLKHFVGFLYNGGKPE